MKSESPDIALITLATGLKLRSPLMYVINLEMNNSLKWALFIIVSGQITSDAMWKKGEVFLLRI